MAGTEPADMRERAQIAGYWPEESNWRRAEKNIYRIVAETGHSRGAKPATLNYLQPLREIISRTRVGFLLIPANQSQIGEFDAESAPTTIWRHSMVISNFLCGPRNWQIETARTIDREIQQRIALKSMQRLRRDVPNVSTRFLILWRNRSFMRERITASQLR